MARKPTICVDFDYTLCLPDTEYKGDLYSEGKIYGSPHPQAKAWLEEILPFYNVVILTARDVTPTFQFNFCEWLRRYDLPPLKVTNIKPSLGILFIDDRAYTFTGNNFPSVQSLREWRPWWKK